MKITKAALRRVIASSGVAATIMCGLGVCAPSTVDGGEATAASASGTATGAPQQEFVVPDGADNQGISLEFGIFKSLEELKAASDIIIVGRPVEVVRTVSESAGPTQFPSDAPDVKTQPRGVDIGTVIRLDVVQVLKGNLSGSTTVDLLEVGRVEAPLIKPISDYLLFLTVNPYHEGTFNTAGGEGQGRWVVDQAGVIRSSVGVEEPYGDRGWRSELLGQRLDQLLPKLR